MIHLFQFLKQLFRGKRTTVQTMPYERFVSNHVMLNAENVKVGHETVSLYSKSYLVSDINYTALTEDEQEVKLRQFSELLNSFDSTVSVQISLVNLPMSREEYESKLILHACGDGHDHQRQEFNTVIHDKLFTVGLADCSSFMESAKIIITNCTRVIFTFCPCSFSR